ncbi:MAG: ABC transporter permease [Oligoflexia bacterium]|nr:ABC transporter permease [Oligoflexia bacterium]
MFRLIKEILLTPRDFIKYRWMIIDLTRSDFRNRYLGSYLGMLWAFISPMVTIAVFVFVFQVGFRVAPIGDIPFILWLTTGIIPWFYFSDAFSQASSSIVEYDFLVKKIVFRVSFLPLIKVFSAVFIHLCFVALIFVMCVYYGFSPSLYWLQIGYYLVASVFLLVGLSWISASIMVFTRDVANMIAIIIQFGFWMTPIFWRIENIPVKYQMIIKLNPVFYIVQGYRDSLIFNKWFWQRPVITLYFWAASILIFLAGLVIFKKTRPHFADVM